MKEEKHTSNGINRTFNSSGHLIDRREYDPDALIHPMLLESQKIESASVHDQDYADFAHRFTLEESKALIIDAMTAYHKDLGAKTREILETANYNDGEHGNEAETRFRTMAYTRPAPGTPNPYLAHDYKLDVKEGARWNLRPVAPGQCRLMRCLPAESEQSEPFSDAFNPANPYPYAVIEFEFDGTIDSVVYMAHEIGHAIADDYGREAGFTHHDNPNHIPEMQAYLTQHILYDHLEKHTDPEIAGTAHAQFTKTMAEARINLADNLNMEERPMSLLTSLALFKHLQEQNQDTKKLASEALLARLGPLNINEVLASAGISSKDDLTMFAQSALSFSRPDAHLISPPTKKQLSH